MPSSSRRIAASRANGAKSRGPATPAGKQVSSLNAVTHGLTAQTVVLNNESRDEYDAHLHAYLVHFAPQTQPEHDLVRQLAAVQWRIARYAAVESGLLEQRMLDQAEAYADELDGQPESHRIALAFRSLAEANGSLSLLNRYQARLHREYQQILKALREMQSARETKAAHQMQSARDGQTSNNRPPNAKLQIEPSSENGHCPADPPALETPQPSDELLPPHSEFRILDSQFSKLQQSSSSTAALGG